MPMRVVRWINAHWINKNPGVAASLVAIVLVAPAYWLWYEENQDTKEISKQNTEAINCIVDSFTTRDKTSKKNIDTLVNFFDQFSDFLRNIEGATSVEPLLNSSDNAKKSLKGVTVTVNANDLKQCLETK